MVKWIIQCVTTAAFTLNVNGDRIGYFKGSRGFRQGDPISLYLFTLIMEIFSLTLQREIDNEYNIQYHALVVSSISCLMFVLLDDLLVVGHGDATYWCIKKALDAFSACSRLLPNYSKSTVVFRSMNKEDRTAISSILPFVTGKLPVIYLGVPFIAKRLGVNECGCLLDKIKSKIKIWKNRYLSYAGRLQLIVAVLESIHVVKVILEKAKLRLLGVLFANLRIKEGWVKWVHSVKLRGKSIWEISIDQEDSWGWKNLLGIRDKIKDKWPSDWYNKFPMIISLNVPAINADIEDKILWKTNSGMITDFSISIVNHDLNIQMMCHCVGNGYSRKDQKESQKQTNPSTEWKGQSQKSSQVKKIQLEGLKLPKPQVILQKKKTRVKIAKKAPLFVSWSTWWFRDSIACLKLSLESSIYIVVWKSVRYGVLELNTAYWNSIRRIKTQYGISGLLGVGFKNKIFQNSCVGNWILRIGPPGYGVSDLLSYSGMVYCISWVRRIELLGYRVLAENVLFLIFDQSIIYNVYTDVDTSYSSKSGNGLLIRQSLGCVV
ncbi:RNA-directed DNA polymerase, eukaryota, reverse transcriptase zinc-binding domain protein [Tanacetum coccineum]